MFALPRPAWRDAELLLFKSIKEANNAKKLSLIGEKVKPQDALSSLKLVMRAIKIVSRNCWERNNQSRVVL